MHLPIQSVHRPAGITPQGCGLIEGMKCAASGAALVAGPCDPLGLPGTIATCLPAAAAYVGNCHQCLGEAATTAVCSAVHLAEGAGVPVPSVLKSLC